MNALIPNAKILSKTACGATLGKPNWSFVDFLDNILTLLIRWIDTQNERLRQTITTFSYNKFSSKQITYKFITYLELK